MSKTLTRSSTKFPNKLTQSATATEFDEEFVLESDDAHVDAVEHELATSGSE